MLVTQGVTLTCGAPGAGLTGHGPSDWGTLLYLGAPDVVVRGLNINAAYEDAIQGYPNPPYGVSPARAQVTDNQVACGPSNVDCVFFMNTTGIQVAHNQIECGLVCVYTWTVTDAVISDNYLAQPTPGYCGIWAQDTIDGTRIERNTLVSTSTLACNYPYGGAIRPNTGTGVVIADNVIRGTWLNGIATAKLSDSRIENNVVEDASWYGIFFSTFTRGVVLDPISRRVLVTGNKLTGRKAGIFAKWACDNVFVANLFGGAAPWAAVFDTTTGQNLFVGRGDVLDNGHFDCDGHGYVDPNLIIGRRIVMGATPDPVLSEVLPDVHGGTLH
jgi:nitrous oxidase accessory protein NosD